MIWANLWFRRGRFVATLLTVSIAVTSFALLASAARGAQVRAIGTVNANFRPVYDILVRPAGTISPVGGRISFDQVDSAYGGISLAQWQKILRLPGIDAAAPVAMVGYVMQTAAVPVDVSRYLSPGIEQQVIAVRPTWVTDRGLTRLADGASYLYATSDRLMFVDPRDVINPNRPPNEGWTDQIHANGTRTTVCDDQAHALGASDPLDTSKRRSISCWSGDPASTASEHTIDRAMPAASGTPARVVVPYSVPMLMAAIDPVQEARLDGLGRALTSGSYFGTDNSSLQKIDESRVGLPVLVASQPELDQSVQFRISRLSRALADRTAAGVSFDNLMDDFDADAGTQLGEQTLPLSAVYPSLLKQITGPLPHAGFDGGAAGTSQVQEYWSVAARHESSTGTTGGEATNSGKISPVEPYDGSQWGTATVDETWLDPLPVELKDGANRDVTHHGIFDWAGASSEEATYLRGIGVYDPAKVDVGPALAGLPSDLYSSTAQAPMDDASRQKLKGLPLLPNANLGGPVPQRPSLLTSLADLSALRRLPYTDLQPADGVSIDAPISTIRVRVSGRIGMDKTSQERVRAVADRIHRATGLRVDLTPGSSIAPTAVTVAAGVSGSPGSGPAHVTAGVSASRGRPALTLAEPWLKTGVATVIVSAIDRKSLLLAILVLTACTLAVGNATSAAVRTRSTELGLLACLGWPRRRLFSLVFVESAAVGLVAGAIGAGLAFAAAPLLDVHLRIGYAASAIPAALLLSLIAALVPAWRATRADPGIAVHPAVALVRSHRSPRRLSGLAMANVVRAPGRTALGAISLALGVASLTLLVIVDLSFRGSITGTILGNAITVQVQAADYIAAAITTLLGAITVADVLYVNIRERSAEFALLGATGWSDAALTRLAGYEALALGVLGAALGAGVSLGVAAALGAALTSLAYLMAGVTALIGIVIAIVAAAVPLRTVRNLPTAQLLAEE